MRYPRIVGGSQFEGFLVGLEERTSLESVERANELERDTGADATPLSAPV